MATSKKRNLNGYIKDSDDSRDFIFKARPKTTELPDSIDLRKKMSPIEDQKTLGSCVPNGIVGCLEYYDKINDGQYENLSRLFLYYNTRILQGTVNEDSGCEIRLAMKALSKQGCCKESMWKYDCRRFRTEPPEKCYVDGIRHTNVSYYRIKTINDIKAALAEGHPVVFGAEVYSSVMSNEVAASGIVPLPTSDDTYEGGHCMDAVGYLDNEKHGDTVGYFIVRNSWGKSWGMKGYCLMPYLYIADPSLVFDIWVLKQG